MTATESIEFNGHRTYGLCGCARKTRSVPFMWNASDLSESHPCKLCVTSDLTYRFIRGNNIVLNLNDMKH